MGLCLGRPKSSEKYKAVDVETKDNTPAAQKDYGSVEKDKKEPYYVAATPPETPTNALNKKLLKKVSEATPGKASPVPEAQPAAKPVPEKTPEPQDTKKKNDKKKGLAPNTPSPQKVNKEKRHSIDMQLGDQLREQLESQKAEKKEAKPAADDESSNNKEEADKAAAEAEAKKKRNQKKRNQKKRERQKKKKAAAAAAKAAGSA